MDLATQFSHPVRQFQIRRYPALALAFAVFSISIAFSTYKIWRDYEIISAKFIPNLWVAAQAEIELLRFLNELHLFAHDETISDAEGPIKRLYILWTRCRFFWRKNRRTFVPWMVRYRP